MQFLGDGIFTVDGQAWSDARALLRPQFVKQRLSDIQIFERHISTMIDLLPKDGETFDLMEWWFRFSLDASTEYLFGKSVETLLNPKASPYFTSLMEVTISKGILTYSADSYVPVQNWSFMVVICSLRFCFFDESRQ